MYTRVIIRVQFNAVKLKLELEYTGALASPVQSTGPLAVAICIWTWTGRPCAGAHTRPSFGDSSRCQCAYGYGGPASHLAAATSRPTTPPPQPGHGYRLMALTDRARCILGADSTLVQCRCCLHNIVYSIVVVSGRLVKVAANPQPRHTNEPAVAGNRNGHRLRSNRRDEPPNATPSCCRHARNKAQVLIIRGSSYESYHAPMYGIIRKADCRSYQLYATAVLGRAANCSCQPRRPACCDGRTLELHNITHPQHAGVVDDLRVPTYPRPLHPFVPRIPVPLQVVDAVFLATLLLDCGRSGCIRRCAGCRGSRPPAEGWQPSFNYRIRRWRARRWHKNGHCTGVYYHCLPPRSALHVQHEQSEVHDLCVSTA